MEETKIPQRTHLSKRNLQLMGIPEEYLKLTLEDYNQNKQIKKAFEVYTSNIHQMYKDRVNLCLYGANGTGKTLLASIVAKEAYKNRYRAMITTIQRLMDVTFKPNKTKEDIEFLDDLKKSEFLILDELGKENFTRTGSNIALVEEYLRDSVTNNRVVIICSNLPLDGDGGLYEQYGNSIKSLVSGSFVKFKFNEEDYRPTVMNNKKRSSINERGIRMLNNNLSNKIAPVIAIGIDSVISEDVEIKVPKYNIFNVFKDKYLYKLKVKEDLKYLINNSYTKYSDCSIVLITLKDYQIDLEEFLEDNFIYFNRLIKVNSIDYLHHLCRYDFLYYFEEDSEIRTKLSLDNVLPLTKINNI